MMTYILPLPGTGPRSYLSWTFYVGPGVKFNFDLTEKRTRRVNFTEGELGVEVAEPGWATLRDSADNKSQHEQEKEPSQQEKSKSGHNKSKRKSRQLKF